MLTISVFEKLYACSGGQPWLTNALVREIVVKMLQNDYARKITPDMVETAKEPLARYMDKLGQKHGYLVIFEKKNSEVLPWEQRIRREVHAVDDKEIVLHGM